MIEVLKQALEAMQDLLDHTETPPDKNCSCHIAPPCSDCVDYSGIRYAIKQSRDTITSLRQAIREHAMYEVQRLGQEIEQEPVAWIEGYPKAHYAEEWFIAKLNDGDRVVLQALPEEFKHDFTTRDGTYFLKESIKAWMQFPDTQFLPPPQQTEQEPVGYLEIDDIESQREYPHNCRNVNLWYESGEGLVAVYTHPPQRKPLTDEQIEQLMDNYDVASLDYARAIEAAHGVKE